MVRWLVLAPQIAWKILCILHCDRKFIKHSCFILSIVIGSWLVRELQIICSTAACNYKPDIVTHDKVRRHFDKGGKIARTTVFCCFRVKSITGSFAIFQQRQANPAGHFSTLYSLRECIRSSFCVKESAWDREEERHPATDTFTDHWACSVQEAWLDGSSAVWVITGFLVNITKIPEILSPQKATLPL